VKISWHPPLLQAVSVSEGDFLMSGGGTYFTAVVDNSEIASYVDIGITLIGNVPGVSGGGMIAMVEFLVEGTGECPLDMTSTLLTPNPNYVPGGTEPQFLEVAHTDKDGTFYTTMTYWKASLVGKSAWPMAHHFDMSARLPDTNNTLYAKVRNQGSMDVTVRTIFKIRDVSGAEIELETAPYLLTTAEGDHTFTVDFDTSVHGSDKYHVEAKVKYDTNGDTYVDTWGTKIKTFSFAVVP